MKKRKRQPSLRLSPPADAAHPDVTWTISDPEIAQIVKQHGQSITLKGLKPGKVTLSAATWDAAAEMEITVTPAPIRVVLTPEEAMLKPEETVALKATVSPASTAARTVLASISTLLGISALGVFASALALKKKNK